MKFSTGGKVVHHVLTSPRASIADLVVITFMWLLIPKPTVKVRIEEAFFYVKTELP